jgi:hypothetical protein
MSIESTGAIAVSLIVALLLLYLWHPPHDDNGKGPGETAP